MKLAPMLQPPKFGLPRLQTSTVHEYSETSNIQPSFGAPMTIQFQATIYSVPIPTIPDAGSLVPLGRWHSYVVGDGCCVLHTTLLRMYMLRHAVSTCDSTLVSVTNAAGWQTASGVHSVHSGMRQRNKILFFCPSVLLLFHFCCCRRRPSFAFVEAIYLSLLTCLASIVYWFLSPVTPNSGPSLHCGTQ